MTFKGTASSDFMRVVKDAQINKSTLIDYAGSDFETLRANLIRYIKAVYPLDYNNFVESDLGMMLIELVSYVGSVTSMKADFLANENFLRTARQRNSVKKLLELIGVRLKGPIGAIANATLTLDTPLSNTPAGQFFTIAPEARTVTVASPEDGEQVSYTLYKYYNGQIQDTNPNGSIALSFLERKAGNSGDVYDRFILLEGSLVTQEGTFGPGNPVRFINLDLGPVIEGSVQVFVQGNPDTQGEYQQVDNLFFVSGGDEKVFQLVPDDDYKATVVFGDNILAKAPSPGDTFVVRYRVGGGTRGNIAKSYINAPITVTKYDGTILNATLENTTQATGGSDAETVEHARKYAPLAFRRQDRLVTLQDYQGFCNSYISSYGSVGKATAAVRRAFSSANIIDIYLLERANNLQLKKASPAFKKQLIDAIEPMKMLTDDVVVVDGLIRTLDLVVTARVSRELLEDEEVIKQDIATIITDYFNTENREFGQEFVPQDLSRHIFALNSVLFATIDNYDSAVKVDFNEFIQLNNFSINIVRV